MTPGDMQGGRSMDDGGVPKRQPRGEESREALLQAGVELLGEETLRDLLSAISSRSVAKRANRSSGSFFHYWPSADAYLDDLIAYVFRSGLLPENVDEIAEDLEEVAGVAGGEGDAIRAICDAAFLDTVRDPFFAVEMLLRSQSRNDRIGDGLRAFYYDTDGTLMPAYESAISSWHCEPRSPFDYGKLSVALTALLEGLAIRHLVDPERVPPALYGELVLALLTGVVGRQGSSDDLAHVFANLVARPPGESG